MVKSETESFWSNVSRLVTIVSCSLFSLGYAVAESQALLADTFDEIREPVIFEVSDAVRGGIEVHTVDNTAEQRIRFSDSLKMGRELLADLVG